MNIEPQKQTIEYSFKNGFECSKGDILIHYYTFFEEFSKHEILAGDYKCTQSVSPSIAIKDITFLKDNKKMGFLDFKKKYREVGESIENELESLFDFYYHEDLF